MWEQIKLKIAQFMSGRNGADELGLFCLIAGLVLDILSRILNFGLLGLLSFALFAWALYRMLSRDLVKRSAENAKYRELFGKSKVEGTQFINRVKNSKEYKYFRCPGCKTRMRLKRGAGERHIRCPKCFKEFDQKA